MAIFYGILGNIGGGGGGTGGIVSKGVYDNPTAAKAAGWAIGDWFTVGINSLYAPVGTLVKILE